MNGLRNIEKTLQPQPYLEIAQNCISDRERTGSLNSREEPNGQDVYKREKNRVAAEKCRRKKKEDTQALHETTHAVSAANNLLKQEIRMLRNQLSDLRMLALKHSMCEVSCNCDAIRECNANRALLAALGRGEFSGWEKLSAQTMPVMAMEITSNPQNSTGH